MIGGEAFFDEWGDKCEGYAIWCYDHLKKQHCKPPTLTTINHSALDESDELSSAKNSEVVDDLDEKSEDDKSTLPEKDTEGSGGGFGLFATRALSRFIKDASASRKEEQQTEKDNNWLSDESTPHNADDSTSLDSSNSDENTSSVYSNSLDTNSIKAGIEDDDLPEMASEDTISVQKQEIVAQHPMFDERMVRITDEHSSTRYSSAVVSWKAKMLTALGTPSSQLTCTSENSKVLCKIALEHLLEQTEDVRAEYALEFEGLLVDELDSNFMTMNSLLDNELHETVDE